MFIEVTAFCCNAEKIYFNINSIVCMYSDTAEDTNKEFTKIITDEVSFKISESYETVKRLIAEAICGKN